MSVTEAPNTESRNESSTELIQKRAMQDRPDAFVPETMVKSFFQRKLGEFDNMKELNNARQMEELGRIAHQWKGNCASFGFAYAGERCSAIENHISEQRLDLVGNEIQLIGEYLRAKERTLN